MFTLRHVIQIHSYVNFPFFKSGFRWVYTVLPYCAQYLALDIRLFITASSEHIVCWDGMPCAAELVIRIETKTRLISDNNRLRSASHVREAFTTAVHVRHKLIRNTCLTRKGSLVETMKEGGYVIKCNMLPMWGNHEATNTKEHQQSSGSLRQYLPHRSSTSQPNSKNQ